MKTVSSIIHSIVGRRILGLFIACALLPICALAFITLRQVSGKAQEESQQRLKHTSKNIAMTILEALSFLKTEMENLGDDVRNSPRPGALEHNGLHSPRIKAFSLVRPDGAAEILSGAPVPSQLNASQQLHLAAGKACLFTTADAAGPLRLFMAIAADRKRPERGVLIGEINTAYLWELVNNTLPHRTDVTILGADGVVLYSSQPVSKEAVERTVHELPHSYSGRFEFDSQAGTQLASYWSFLLKANYSYDPWTVVVSTSRNEAFGTVKTFTWTFVSILLLTVLVAYFLSSVQIRRILVPLTKLLEGTGNVGKGEFSRQVEITSGDEFETVGRSFNSMAELLADQFRILEDTSNIVRSILIAPNEESIISAVLANLHTVIDGHLIGLTLLDPGEPGSARTYLSCRPGEPDENGTPYRTVFSQKELQQLQNESELLSVESDRAFTSLLSPMKSQGAMSFNLLPFFIEEQLAGVLVLGNLSLSRQDHEGLFRARTITDQVAVALAKARLMKEHEQLNWGTLHALARTVDTKSKWTAGHSERVAALAQDIGRALGMSARELDLLHRGGLLHDIGKIGVSESLLDKPSELTAAEIASIREHPAKGALILEPINAFTEIIPLVSEHHERFNGTGYPRGLAGEAISFGARILAVADVYDALISERPYREGWELHKVLSYIDKQAGIMFDPVAVQALLTLHPDHVRQAPVAIPCCEAGEPDPVLLEQA